MAKPTKVVVHFDDGSTIEQTLDGITSIFVNEAAAKRCGRNPPYKQGGKKNNDTTAETDATLAAAGGTAGQCYYINGMIFCP